MGQKVRPTGFRVGIMEDWRSRWYASKHEFADLLVEDFKIRKFIKNKYGFAGIPKIEIERTRDAVTVLLSTARPGVIIGRKGAEVEKLQEELQNLTGRRIEIKIVEVARPEIDAQLISEDIAEQLQKRSSFRRTMKRAIEQTMDGGAKGVKIQLSGRLGGAEMSRTEAAAAGLGSPEHAAGQDRLRLRRGQDGAGPYRDQGVGQPGRLFEDGGRRWL